MEYENELDLGLGLSCGDSSSKTVQKDATPSVILTDDGDKDNAAECLKNFFQSDNPKDDAGIEKQKNTGDISQGSFFNKLSMSVNHKNTMDNDDGKASYIANKRKIFSDEKNDNKRHESEVHCAGALDREKTPHISINTDDGSTAENEDVVDSEVECSAPISNHATTRKNVVEAEETKNLNPSSDNEVILGNMNGNAPYSVRPVSGMKIPGYLPHNVVQMLPPANGERPLTPPNNQMAFGYMPTQLPILTRDHTWGMVARLQQPNPSNFSRVPDNIGMASERQTNVMQTYQDAANENGTKLVRDGSRNVATEAEASNRTASKDKTASAQLTVGSSSVIKPGIAADIKFGGSGTCPNLPWVSTTGLKGRTISGVTYRFSPNQIKIVCACHGSHLTPDEFVRHASDEFTNQNDSNRMGLLPNTNPAASAQS